MRILSSLVSFVFRYRLITPKIAAIVDAINTEIFAKSTALLDVYARFATNIDIED